MKRILNTWFFWPFKLIYWILFFIWSPRKARGKFKFWWKWRVARYNVKSRTMNKRMFRMPKNLTDSQRTAVETTVKLIHDKESELLYATETSECFIKNESLDGTIYIFIERDNIKIINTVFGYDVPIDNDTEIYLKNLFKRKQQQARNRFKREALNKVQHSLHTVLDKVNKQK